MAIPEVNGEGTALPTTIQLAPPEPTIVPATDLGGVEVLKHGNLYLLSDPAGNVHPDARGLGFYDLDTRVLSCAALRINGVLPTSGAGTASSDPGSIELTSPAITVLRRRWISGGLAERIDVTNGSAAGQRVVLELDLDSDAADIFEVRGLVRACRGQHQPVAVTTESVAFAYEGLDGFVRRTLVSISTADVTSTRGSAAPTGDGSVRVRWVLDLAPGATATVRWEVATDLVPVGGRAANPESTADRLARWASPTRAAADGVENRLADPSVAAADERRWRARWARIDSDGEVLDLAIRQGIADLYLLRNDGPLPGDHYLAAGIPWYTTLFGRDSIIASLMVLPFMPDIARETLRVLADWQATEDDPERDMEPGKILHELRVGELARAGEVPHRPYYGSVDATPLWLILLDETYRWTGDLALVRSLWPNALAALAWIDRFGDRDGDGFVEYGRRTAAGQLNQGWKDSEDPVRHRDGRIADGPIALVEVQGYVHDAKRRVASLAERLGDEALAGRLYGEATALQRRFDEAFWMPDANFYAVALDGDKRQVGTITSNPGHALWSGIVPQERVDAVVDRLVDPSMDGGWGIRTYAAGQPGYDPIGYHTGSVWPHDNALVAAGMRRAGRHDAAGRVAARILDASRQFPDQRLPELFSGLDRAVERAPARYPAACSPQAWSAATPLSLLQTLLGLQADAAAGRLELDRPRLPAEAGRITVRGLRVGDGTVDLRFHRTGAGTTAAEVTHQDGPLEVVVRGHGRS